MQNETNHTEKKNSFNVFRDAFHGIQNYDVRDNVNRAYSTYDGNGTQGSLFVPSDPHQKNVQTYRLSAILLIRNSRSRKMPPTKSCSEKAELLSLLLNFPVRFRICGTTLNKSPAKSFEEALRCPPLGLELRKISLLRNT